MSRQITVKELVAVLGTLVGFIMVFSSLCYIGGFWVQRGQIAAIEINQPRR